MIIHENGWSVGSLSAPDPNAQSFKSPGRQHSGARKHSLLDGVLDEGDVFAIETQAAYRSENNSATARLGNAIAFNQTQDAFLQKVQESLQRMNELTALAKTAAAPEGAKAAYATEFVQLQDRIKEIGTKMFKAVGLFQSSDPELVLGSMESGTPAAPLVSGRSINDFIENTANPMTTAIGDAANASLAGSQINKALEAVAEMRSKVGSTLQRLCLTGESIFALAESLADTHRSIKDINVAEASTEFARFDMLAHSGTAMLAQANALPESALRLLD